MKILTLLGARPQFIKAGTVSREFSKHETIKEVIVHTGQHYDANMSDIFFDEMKIPKPDYFLGIGGKSHGAMTGQMIEKAEEVVLKECPDVVMVYGDTNTTLAGAIVASKLHIPLAHVEAGLRSFNMKMPEEINRILTDRISSLLFCPTDAAVRNLLNEGYFSEENGKRIPSFGFGKVVKSGDVMHDGALFYSRYARKPESIGNLNGSFALATIHRAENTDSIDRLKSICDAFEVIGGEQPIVLPLHPRTRKIMAENGLKLSNNIIIIDPIGYFEMIWLIKNSSIILTDSGGLQKEAFFFSKKCITLRDETEWTELLENRFNTLAGAEKDVIVDAYRNFKFNEDFSIDLYGGGMAAQNIAAELLNDYKI